MIGLRSGTHFENPEERIVCNADAYMIILGPFLAIYDIDILECWYGSVKAPSDHISKMESSPIHIPYTLLFPIVKYPIAQNLEALWVLSYNFCSDLQNFPPIHYEFWISS